MRFCCYGYLFDTSASVHLLPTLSDNCVLNVRFSIKSASRFRHSKYERSRFCAQRRPKRGRMINLRSHRPECPVIRGPQSQQPWRAFPLVRGHFTVSIASTNCCVPSSHGDVRRVTVEDRQVFILFNFTNIVVTESRRWNYGHMSRY